jgi:hypothetical protein
LLLADLLLNVSVPIASLRELLLTVVALEWHLLSVASQVSSQVVELIEFLRAHLALKHLVLSVSLRIAFHHQ